MGYWRITVFLIMVTISVVSLCREVTVAVIDTGLDLDHSSLRGNLWTNPGESGVDAYGGRKESNQIDDDDNGWIDDVHGVDFSNSKVGIYDLHGHGTHVAGIIVKANPQARILSLKYYDREVKETSMRSSLEALRYAIDKNVDIINYSGGGYGWNQEEFELLKKAKKKEILVVAAAGNDGLDLREHPFYPNCYPLSNIIPVAGLSGASEIPRTLASFSNYGNDSENFAAPSKGIWSTLPGGGWGSMSGTSQATAIITGLASRLLSLGNEKSLIKKILRRSLKRGDHLKHTFSALLAR